MTKQKMEYATEPPKTRSKHRLQFCVTHHVSSLADYSVCCMYFMNVCTSSLVMLFLGALKKHHISGYDLALLSTVCSKVSGLGPSGIRRAFQACHADKLWTAAVLMETVLACTQSYHRNFHPPIPYMYPIRLRHLSTAVRQFIYVRRQEIQQTSVQTNIA